MRQEPNFDAKPTSPKRAELSGESRQARRLSAGIQVGLPGSVKLLLVLIAAAVGWITWAYLSADAFLNAYARRDRLTIEDYVDRAGFQRSLEAAAETTERREGSSDPIVALLSHLGSQILIARAPTFELVELVMPKNGRINFIRPTAPARMLVTVVNSRNEGIQLILAFRDFGWHVVGFRY